MPGFNSLSVRDLVALVVIAARTMREGAIEPETLVDSAYAVSDQFVLKSEGQWAHGARVNHAQRAAAAVAKRG